MSIMLRDQFPDLVGADALPALEFIVQDEFASFQPRFEILYNVKDMVTSIAQATQVSSIEAAGTVGEGEQVPLQKLVQGFDKTYTAVKRGVMLAVSQELLDDLQFDVMAQNAQKLTKSIMQSVEISSADVLNNGFTTAGPDGVPLLSTAHPLLAQGTGTNSNQLAVAADLSETTVKSLVTLMRGTLDTAGNKINIMPKQLVVAPENEFLAFEILKSQFITRSDNAFVNSTNSISAQHPMEPIVWDFLTDDDAVFMLADKADHSLCFWWRKQPEISTDFDFKSEVDLMKITSRWDVGFHDWRGIVGTEGA